MASSFKGADQADFVLMVKTALTVNIAGLLAPAVSPTDIRALCRYNSDTIFTEFRRRSGPRRQEFQCRQKAIPIHGLKHDRLSPRER